MQESKELEDRMRDAYSQIRRSAHDTGASHSSIGTITIGSHQHGRSHCSRDVTLLENGLIVERINVKKEEKEERKRRKREERRGRSRTTKSSRDSGNDFHSIYGPPHPSQLLQSTSGGSPAELSSRAPRYSQSSLRPTSIMSWSIGERSPTLPRAYSTTSSPDLRSTAGSTSPNRRPRLFGNLGTRFFGNLRTKFFGSLRTPSPGGRKSRGDLAVS
jgi:hypothetical protein